MDSPDDLRRLRNRQDDYDAELAAVPDQLTAGAARLACRTVDGGNYPMVTAVFVKVQPVSLLGEEKEGSEVAIATISDRTFYSYSMGTTPPVPGALVECVWVPYRWITICEGNGGGTARVEATAFDVGADMYRLVHLDENENTTSARFVALNYGIAEAPVNTSVDYYWATSRWAFRYDGV